MIDPSKLTITKKIVSAITADTAELITIASDDLGGFSMEQLVEIRTLCVTAAALLEESRAAADKAYDHIQETIDSRLVPAEPQPE